MNASVAPSVAPDHHDDRSLDYAERRAGAEGEDRGGDEEHDADGVDERIENVAGEAESATQARNASEPLGDREDAEEDHDRGERDQHESDFEKPGFRQRRDSN